MQGISDSASVEEKRTARLDQTLAYQGSVHDNDAARRFGFERAIVPGVYPYGFMAQMVMRTWGLEWLTRGTMQSRSRRPLFDGENVIVIADKIQSGADASEVALRVENASGEDAVTGFATLSKSMPPRLDLKDFPVLPMPVTPIIVAAGQMRAGMRFGSLMEQVTDDYFAQSLIDFDERDTRFLDQKIIHPGLILRLSFRHTMFTYKTPTPGIYVSSEAQYYGLLHVGETITSSAVVTDAYERKGHHYVEVDQLLIANGNRPVARFRRCSIYATRS